MASIIIREEDLTTNTLDESITDIAYVPGFGATGDDYADKGTPILCTSLGQFEALFGDTPRTFTEGATFGDLGFDAAACAATTDIMFNGPTEATGTEPEKSGDPDPGYIYAHELLSAGIPVYYERVNSNTDTDVTPQMMYDALNGVAAASGTAAQESILRKLADRGTYRIKYLTTGGYPIFERTTAVNDGTVETAQTIVEILLEVAEADYFEDSAISSTGRGDCIALIDHTNYAGRPLIGTGSVFASVNNSDGPFKDIQQKLSYAAMFTPWANYGVSVHGVSSCDLPASFAYIKCLGSALRDYANWFAIAGVARGTVKGINNILTDELLTNNIANRYQLDNKGPNDLGISINAITRIQPYGQVIWGNRTLAIIQDEGLKATNYLNIRNMVCDIKKVLYRAARRYMFEQNSDALWINFRSMVTPLLDQMLTGQGLASYTMTRGNNTAKTKLYANISITPIYAVESFDITVQITDEDASVSES